MYGQKKLDGVRCLARWVNNKVVLTSRNGKEWNCVPHINKELQSYLPKESVLDGELYIHGETFQEITRLVKKQREESIKVEYHVYDYPSWYGNPFLVWSVREENLNELFKNIPANSKIKLVNSYHLTDEQEAIFLHDQVVSEGYEGLILRESNGLYEFGYRSNSLLKLKKFDDGEFTVVGYKSGTPGTKYENAVCYRCVTEDGITEFDVNPKMTIAEKEQALIDAPKCIGQKLKVRHFGRSESQVPRFPISLGFRLEQDMD